MNFEFEFVKFFMNCEFFGCVELDINQHDTTHNLTGSRSRVFDRTYREKGTEMK
jgi:hypothetical protein